MNAMRPAARTFPRSTAEGPADDARPARGRHGGRRGELVAVMGPSGSGKSTLLTIAGTLEQADRREVLVDGTDVPDWPRHRGPGCAGAAIGFVFQDFNLLAGLSALENVALPLELDGTRARVARAAAADALEQLGLPAGRPLPRSTFPAANGSGWRSPAHRRERNLLLADEPTGALDSVNGELVMRMLRSACKDGHGRQWWSPTTHSWPPGRTGWCSSATARSSTRPAPPRAGIAARQRRRRMSGGFPARAAMVRWSVRMFRREWRRQLLMLILLTIAVAGAVFGWPRPTTQRRTTTRPSAAPTLAAL